MRAGRAGRAEDTWGQALAIHREVGNRRAEGIVLGEEVNLRTLLGLLKMFAVEVAGAREFKFVPGYFPFTEPSAEMDVECFVCGGAGCPVCKQSGWLEILGSGMIDPAVFGFVGYDPEEWAGFAFGLGVERIAMLKYGIDDIQMFFQNDARFLRQFP